MKFVDSFRITSACFLFIFTYATNLLSTKAVNISSLYIRVRQIINETINHNLPPTMIMSCHHSSLQIKQIIIWFMETFLCSSKFNEMLPTKVLTFMMNMISTNSSFTDYGRHSFGSMKSFSWQFSSLLRMMFSWVSIDECHLCVGGIRLLADISLRSFFLNCQTEHRLHHTLPLVSFRYAKECLQSFLRQAKAANHH